MAKRRKSLYARQRKTSGVGKSIGGLGGVITGGTIGEVVVTGVGGMVGLASGMGWLLGGAVAGGYVGKKIEKGIVKRRMKKRK